MTAGGEAWLFTGGAGMIYKTTWYGLIYFLIILLSSWIFYAVMTRNEEW